MPNNHRLSPTRQAALEKLCRAQTLEMHAPATVLTTVAHEHLFSLGPTERYLRVATGHASTDILAMVADEVRLPLRAAMVHAERDHAPISVAGGSTIQDGHSIAFTIEVRPISHEGEELLLVHFVDQPGHEPGLVSAATSGNQDAPTALAGGASKPFRQDRAGVDRVRGDDAHTVFVVDDDRNFCDAVCGMLTGDGRTVEAYATSEAFLQAYHPGSDGLLLVDAYLPGMSRLDLILHLRAHGDPLPAIMIAGSNDVPMAVRAMRAGAADYMEKPVSRPGLLVSVDRALEQSRDTCSLRAWQASAAEHIGKLTPRQHEIMDLVLAGHPSKNIAADLGISQRTVENHRASIMATTGTKSLPELARLALAASAAGAPPFVSDAG